MKEPRKHLSASHLFVGFAPPSRFCLILFLRLPLLCGRRACSSILGDHGFLLQSRLDVWRMAACQEGKGGRAAARACVRCSTLCGPVGLIDLVTNEELTRGGFWFWFAFRFRLLVLPTGFVLFCFPVSFRFVSFVCIGFFVSLRFHSPFHSIRGVPIRSVFRFVFVCFRFALFCFDYFRVISFSFRFPRLI